MELIRQVVNSQVNWLVCCNWVRLFMVALILVLERREDRLVTCPKKMFTDLDYRRLLKKAEYECYFISLALTFQWILFRLRKFLFELVEWFHLHFMNENSEVMCEIYEHSSRFLVILHAIILIVIYLPGWSCLSLFGLVWDT